MAFKDFIRGGQITLHQVRMTSQLLFSLAGVALLVFIVVSVVFFLVKHNRKTT